MKNGDHFMISNLLPVIEEQFNKNHIVTSQENVILIFGQGIEPTNSLNLKRKCRQRPTSRSLKRIR